MGNDSWQTVGRALSDLERRYDGPIPAALRRQALAGGPAAAGHRDAIGRSALFDRLARRAVAAIARQRRQALAAGRAGPTRADTPADLAGYRAAGLFWRGLTEP
ncbi:MAG TPA: hypothetical protein VFE11_06650 [Dongiaceae bacterium]|jgi:hypothetical protein|nr:hypothetical protein [Dongiaceae bacterium]